MKVNRVEFVISAVQPSQYPKDTLPEVALAGRSNVGKSSFINSMVNRRKLAHTSSKPGKTATLNFYKVENAFYFVDLPGYGYAQVSKKEKARWAQMIETYLTTRDNLKKVVLLVDLRHPPTQDDQMMWQWLNHVGLPAMVVATKADKVSRGQRQKHLQVIREVLQLPPDYPLYPFSAETKEGRDAVWADLKQTVIAPNGRAVNGT